jgi:hypothetical protein
VQAWKIIQFKVTSSQSRAQLLLTEWQALRSSGACTFIFDIQENKDKLENMAALLSAEMYCSPVEHLDLICSRFEQELEKFRNRVHIDLIAGLKSKTK